MPIDYKLYGEQFKKLSRELRKYGRCANCGAANKSVYSTPTLKGTLKIKTVVLTVHHLNGNIADNDLNNLLPLCQKCHFQAHRTGLDYPIKKDPAHWAWQNWLYSRHVELMEIK